LTASLRKFILMSSRLDTPTPIAVSKTERPRFSFLQIYKRKVGAGTSTRTKIPEPNAAELPVKFFATKPGRDISVIIVNYNVREFLRQSLLSLRKALPHLAAEIFVVDNASNDGSVAMVRQGFPEVELIANHDNVGFAAANNQALRQAHGRFVVLLNPDTIVQEDTFTAIQAFFAQHPATGMVGCKVLNPDGTLQLACRRSFPTPWIAFTRLSGLSRLFPKSRWFGRYNLTYLPENETTEVEAISGSFMAVRREALAQVGLLDEEFFLYGEDLDWCFRMRAAGWKIHYFPGTQIIHFKGESARQSDLDNLRLFYQAMGLFVRKHFRPDSPLGFYKGKSGLRSVSYWLLHLAIWFRALLAFVRPIARRLSAPMIDLALMQFSMMAAVWWRFDGLEVWPRFFIVDAVYSFFWLACLALFGCYRHWRYSFYQAFAAMLTGFLINASLTYFFKEYAFSRAVVLAAGLMNILLLAGWRLLMKISRSSFVASERKLGRTIVVGDFAADGSEALAGALLEKLKTRCEGNYDLVGLVSLSAGEVGNYYAGLPVLTSLERLDAWLDSAVDPRSSLLKIPKESRGIQQVIFSTPRIPFGRILEVMSHQREQRLSFKLIPSHLDVIIGKSGIDQITEVPLLEIENRLLRFWPAFGKRMLDTALAGFFLVLGAPFFLLLWLLKGKLQSQTIQMTPTLLPSDLQKEGRGSLRLWQLLPKRRWATGDGRKVMGESRTLRPSSFTLRNWPWLFAILSGELSWVGLAISPDKPDRQNLPPAPDALFVLAKENRELDAYSLHLPLGVADLTRINRRGQLSPEEKNKLYLYYVTHYSPLLDLEILLRTVFRF